MEIFDFKCKYCGGELYEVDGHKSVGKCKYCGSKQTLPKLYSEHRANMFSRANHLRRNNEFDRAEMLYEQILNEDPTDPEAYWLLVLCRFGIEYVEDAWTKELKPTVNRTQLTSIFADEDYKSAIKYANEEQKELYQHEAFTINEIQKGILEISRREAPFDVFICYKETDENGKRSKDSVLAHDLYRELIRDGYKVFFARETLSNKIGSAYEPYIFSALNSSKVMVVLGTKREHFEAVWVRNEWSRFLGQIKSGKRKTLIPVYKDMDAYDLPPEFANLQALNMDRIGYLQELITGVENIVRLSHKRDIFAREKLSEEEKRLKKAAKAEKITEPKPEKPPKAEKVKEPKPEKSLLPNKKDKSEKQPIKKYPAIIAFTAIFLALAIGIGVFTIMMNTNSSSSESENLVFTLNNDTNSYTVSSTNKQLQKLVIPSTYNDKPVTTIGGNAFSDCTELTSVTIPDTVTRIDNYAFQNCTALTSITIPDNVIRIGAYVFSGCTALTDITIPFVGEMKSGTENTNFKYIFGENVPTSLKNVVITSAENIDTKAFAHCESLASITIPDSVKSIGASAFSGCTTLTSITIPNYVKSIGASAFSGCSGLTSITIPNYVTSIEESAFSGCSGLTSITIPNSVTSIGASAFLGCSGLTSITIPNSVTSIGASAFSGCSGLTSITIPYGVKDIGVSAFSGCSGLTSINIPYTLKSIGVFAFSGCSGLTSINIPYTLKSIGAAAFFNCNALRYIHFSGTKAEWQKLENSSNIYIKCTIYCTDGTIAY